MAHVPEFIADMNFALGFTSVQVVEVQHSCYDELYPRYRTRTLTSSTYPHHLLNLVRHCNNMHVQQDRLKEGGWLSVPSMGEIGKGLCPNLLRPFLENIDRRSLTAGSLFQFFTTLIENADPLLRRWLAPWSPLLGRVEREEGKTSSDQYPKDP